MENNIYDFQLEIKPYLDVDESVLWCDKPVKKLAFSTADIFTTMFGVVWLSFSVFWIISAYTATEMAEGGFKLFPLFGIPFVLVGLYLLIFRHFVSFIRRKNMIYALTSKRVLVVHTGSRQYVQEYRYENISNIQMKCNGEDIGSIFFFTGEVRFNNGRSYSSTSGIFGIKDTKKVYKILSQCMEKNKK